MTERRHEAPESFQLTSSHRRFILYQLRSMVGENDAEDMLQEAYLHAWKDREMFRGEYPWDTWVMRIAKYRALSYRRALTSRPEGTSVSLDAPIEGQASIDPNLPAVERPHRWEYLEELKIHLTPKQLQAVLIDIKLGRTNYAIAARSLGCSILAYASRLTDARKALRKYSLLRPQGSRKRRTDYKVNMAKLDIEASMGPKDEHEEEK